MELFAYLDPGTGSLVLQVVVGTILGIGVILKTYWAKITRIFRRGDKSSDTTAKAATEKTKATKKAE